MPENDHLQASVVYFFLSSAGTILEYIGLPTNLLVTCCLGRIQYNFLTIWGQMESLLSSHQYSPGLQ